MIINQNLALFCCRHGVNPPVVAECEGDYTFDKRSGSLQWQVRERESELQYSESYFGAKFKFVLNILPPSIVYFSFL